MALCIVEGEKKAIGLDALAWHGLGESADRPRWLTIGIAGAWNFWGSIGKTEGHDGARLDVKGCIPDIERITWLHRDVVIVRDANARINPSIHAASEKLAHELPKRGTASVLFVDMPADAGVSGIDDLAGLWGRDRVLEYLKTAAYDPQKRSQESKYDRIEDLPRLSELKAKKLRFFIPGFIAPGLVHVCTSESGHGKSYLFFWLLSRLSRGEHVFGRETVQCPVLILDRETPGSIIEERVVDLHINGDDPNLHYFGSFVGEEPPAPDSPIVLDFARRNSDSVILIDSQVAFFDGDENSATDTRKFYAGVRKLADCGPAVIILHHSGKSETARKYRGSSDIKGSIDTAWHLTNIGGNRLTKMRLEAWKVRSAQFDTEFVFQYEQGNFISDQRSHALDRNVTEQLTALLRKNPGIGAGAFETLAGKAGLGYGRARSFLEAGLAAGEICTEKGARNSIHYYLVEGDEAAENDASFRF
jgi:hypothetical protein